MHHIVEPKTTTPEFVDKKHRAYEGLNNDMHGDDLATLEFERCSYVLDFNFYNTMAYSSFEKYGKYTGSRT